MIRLLDLIVLHQEAHENAVLYLLRAGPHAGRTSLVKLPNCFAIEITDPKLSVQKLEQMISDFRLLGCLRPQGHHQIINGEQFLDLMVEVDELGMMNAHCEMPKFDHG